jgi:sporulation protein YlmC with PRC-barrel domain
MKRILMTTALVAFASTPVLAQTQATTEAADTAGHEMTMQTQHGIYLTPTGEATIYGSEFIGKNVYVTEGANDLRAVDGVPDDWENVAAIDDVVMTRDGEVRGVLIDVGGFLGIGARKVAVDMSALDIVYDRDDDDFYVVFTSTREDLESAPEYDTSIDTQNRVETWESAGMARDGAEQRPTDTNMQAAERPVTGSAQPMERDVPARDGYMNVAHGDLSVDDLTSASVYSENDENIAGVSDVLVTEDGRVTNLIVDVGGFLGIGAKSVAIDFEEVKVYRGNDTDDLRVYLPMTRDQLEDMPEYEG